MLSALQIVRIRNTKNIYSGNVYFGLDVMLPPAAFSAGKIPVRITSSVESVYIDRLP